MPDQSKNYVAYRKRLWAPKFEKTARGTGRTRNFTGTLPQHEDPWGDPSEWEAAPASSHLVSFKLTRATYHKLFRQSGFADINILVTIHIRFKIMLHGEWQGLFNEYVYAFDDVKEAEFVWFALCNADHPGSVVHYELDGKVPYQKLV